MRDIDKIVIHCSAGNIGNTAADIVHFHTGPKDKGCRGWKTPGYHYFVDKDGKVSRLVPEDRISNGVKGHNAHAINICYAGGVDQKTSRIRWIPHSGAENRSRRTHQGRAFQISGCRCLRASGFRK